jgi:hypothetical protein
VATPVDICNLGLSHIGARAQIVSISPPDGTVESGYCARFYPLVRRELLELQPWTFAAKRVALSQVTNPSTIWAYAYALPADCVRARRVLPLALADSYSITLLSYEEHFPNDLVQTVFSERGGSPYEIEGSMLLTNEPDAVLIYTREVTDSNTFSPRFVIAAGMLMASYLAGPIIKGVEGARTSAQWRQAAAQYAQEAATSNANQSQQSNEFMPGSLAARG